MSLTIAHRHAWSLARTLNGLRHPVPRRYDDGAVPTSEFDGDADSIVREYDPFNPLTAPNRVAPHGWMPNGYSSGRAFLLWISGTLRCSGGGERVPCPWLQGGRHADRLCPDNRRSIAELRAPVPPFGLRAATFRGLSCWFGDLPGRQRNSRHARRRSHCSDNPDCSRAPGVGFRKVRHNAGSGWRRLCCAGYRCGYHAVHGIASATMPTSGWQFAVSLLGAAIIAAASWTKWSRVRP